MERRWIIHLLTVLMLFNAAGCTFRLNPYSLEVRSHELPFEITPVHFGDLSFDSRLNRVIVPAAESGDLVLIDPDTLQTQLVAGFSRPTGGSTNANEPSGAISADSGRGWIFVLDRSARKIAVIDGKSGKISASVAIQNPAEAIRYVSATNEVWVTEEEGHQVEVFSLGGTETPELQSTLAIPIPNGPSQLLIDRKRGLAFTHQPGLGTTVVIQVMTHAIIEQWGNGCSQARGMAVDEDRGYLFVACAEGKLVVMDINNHGSQLTSQNFGGDLGSVAYNAARRHIYLPSAASGILAIFSLQTGTPNGSTGTVNPTQEPLPSPQSSNLQLVRLGTADTAVGASCATVDGANRVWVCDPEHGKLFMLQDDFK